MKIKTKEMILVSIFAVLTALGAIIKIPVGPVPMTFQLLFVLSAGIFLGARLGALSQIVYIMMGLIGIPVFANGGGPQYFIEPTFGYILGFIFAAYLTGMISGRLLESRRIPAYFAVLIATLAGTAAIYICGISYLFLIKNVRFGANMTVLQAVAIGMSALIWKDILICFVLAAIPMKFIKTVRRIPAPPAQ